MESMPPTTSANNERRHSSSSSVASRRGSVGASRRVRFNILQLTGSAWHRISRTNKVLLIFSVVMLIIQVVASVTVLAVAHNEACDKPLNVYLIVYAIRVALSGPLVAYQYLGQPPRLYRLNNAQTNATQRQANDATTNSNIPPSSEGSPSTSSTEASHPPRVSQQTHPTDDRSTSGHVPNSSNGTNNNTANDTSNTSNTSDNPSPSPPQPPFLRRSHTEWVDRTKSVLDLVAILWFIVGNYFIFTTQDCAHNATALFYTTLAWVLLGYLIILIPLFLCASLIFCLPCVLVFLSALNIGDVPGMTGGTREEIRTVPVYRYRTPEDAPGADTQQGQEHENQQGPGGVSAATSTASSTGATSGKLGGGFWRRLLLRRRKDDQELESSYEELTITPAEDAVCTICLSDYEDGDLVCKLRCEHHFHKDCVHEWLALNSVCPLCKRDFRGKTESNEGESAGSEEPH